MQLFFIFAVFDRVIKRTAAAFRFKENCLGGRGALGRVQAVGEAVAVCRFASVRRIDSDRDPLRLAGFALCQSVDFAERRFDPGRGNGRDDRTLGKLILFSVVEDAFDDRLFEADRPRDLVLFDIEAVERVFGHEQQESGAAPDVLFQRFVIAVADGQTFVVPDPPAGFVERFQDRQHPISVLVRVADEDKRLFFIGEEGGGEHFDPRRDQPAERLILKIEEKGNVVFDAKLMRVGAFTANDRSIAEIIRVVDVVHTIGNDEYGQVCTPVKQILFNCGCKTRYGERSQAFTTFECPFFDFCYTVRDDDRST